MNYGFVIDTGSCIGCHACSTACKSENQVPVGVNRTWVKAVEKGRYPDVTRSFQVTRCNHCANPPCVRSCPTAAMYQRNDGIVEFDPEICIGCKACMQACPYDAIYIDPDTRTAAKCHYCGHRVDRGQEPACVVVCPEHAIIAGDMDDPNSEISRTLAKHSVTVRKPEQGTAPKTFYIQGNDASLHPTAAERTPAEYAFADVLSLHPGEPVHVNGFGSVGAGATHFNGSQMRAPQPQGMPEAGPIQIAGTPAEQMVQVAYNAQHKVPWHWPIPLYIVTKGTAGGFFAFASVGIITGAWIPSATVMGVGGAISILLTLVTLALLLYDLDRPERFLYLLIRPQWRSWVARAAWILSGFSALTGLWWLMEVLGVEAARMPLAVVSLPFSIMAVIYTAFLFAQAEGRDLWQSQVTPIHMALQGAYLGSGLVGALALALPLPDAAVNLAQSVFLLSLAASAVTILFGEFRGSYASELAARAAREIKQGSYKNHFWWGGIVLGHLVPLVLGIISPLALGPALLAAAIGLFLYEYAFVMAPQELPNS